VKSPIEEEEEEERERRRERINGPVVDCFLRMMLHSVIVDCSLEENGRWLVGQEFTPHMQW
jgi:hypothetical protein